MAETPEEIGDDFDTDTFEELPGSGLMRRSTMTGLRSRRSSAGKSMRLSIVESEQEVSKFSKGVLEPSQRLYTDPKVLSAAIWAVRFGVLADQLNSQVLGPNYALLVLPGGHSESFDSTGPFDFGAANYFIPTTSDLGMLVASIFFGKLSDKYGRKYCMLICLYVGTITAIAKYLLRGNFWTFCGMNFLNGLFAAALPLATAFVGDVYSDRSHKDQEMGTLIAVGLFGRTGGGIIAIMMQPTGLFTPLLVSSAISALAGLICHKWMIEPNKELQHNLKKKDDDALSEAPTKLSEEAEDMDPKIVFNILLGSLADNFGSGGLVPICLSPLMFNTFYADFVAQDLEPVMSEVAYKWIYVLVAVIVVPGAMAGPVLFRRFGPALCAVAANILTGAVTVALLHIGLATPTSATFAIFVAVLYISFPFTVISQLASGPMLDRVAPASKRGQVQGLNNASINLSGAVGSFLYGILADNRGIDICLYTTASISISAALVNLPLVFDARLRREDAEQDDATQDIVAIDEDTEDQVLLERIRRGSWVPAETLLQINERRIQRGDPTVVARYGKYADNADKDPAYHKQIILDYLFHINHALELLEQAKKEESRLSVCEKLNAIQSVHQSQEAKEIQHELGEWFADYMVANGYNILSSPVLIKDMIMSAFPPIVEGARPVTPDNVEFRLLNFIKMLGKFHAVEERNIEPEGTSFSSVMAHRSNICTAGSPSHL